MLEKGWTKIPWYANVKGNFACQVLKLWIKGATAQRVEVEHYANQWNTWKDFVGEDTRFGRTSSTWQCHKDGSNCKKGNNS